MSSSQRLPKLLCDENIPWKVVKLLEKQGFNVKKAFFDPGESDDELIAEQAKTEDRVILSFDRHFGNILLFPPEKYGGIIFIRIRPPLIDTVFSSLMNLFSLVRPSEFKGKLYALKPFGFRVYPPKRAR